MNKGKSITDFIKEFIDIEKISIDEIIKICDNLEKLELKKKVSM